MCLASKTLCTSETHLAISFPDPKKMANPPITHIQSTSISRARTAEDKEAIL